MAIRRVLRRVPAVGVREWVLPALDAAVFSSNRKAKQRMGPAELFKHMGAAVLAAADELVARVPAWKPSAGATVAAVADALRQLHEATVKEAIDLYDRDFLPSEKMAEERSSRPVSGCTLIVVPSPLLDHWEEQLRRHVDWRALLVDHYWDDPPPPGDERWEAAQEEAFRDAVYVDRSSSGMLPPVEALVGAKAGKRLVVLTSKARISQQGSRKGAVCGPLQRVQWLRLVVDEGHTLSSTSTKYFHYLHDIPAERRWIMSGTPTKDSRGRGALSDLFGLLQYLHHATSLDKWQSLIGRPFAKGAPVASERLIAVLRTIMMRHVKADVPDLPAPRRRISLLDLSPKEKTAYNTRAAFTMANILLTKKPHDDKINPESLLHPMQSGPAMENMKMLQLMCNGAGQQALSLRERNRKDTRVLFLTPELLKKDAENSRASLGRVTDEEWARVQRFISHTTAGRGTVCCNCGMRLSLNLITPCAHVVCCECVCLEVLPPAGEVRNRVRCLHPCCGREYAFEALQLLQPGFDIDWAETLLEQAQLLEHRRLERQLAAPAAASAAPAAAPMAAPAAALPALAPAPAGADGPGAALFSLADAGFSNAKAEHLVKRLRELREERRRAVRFDSPTRLSPPAPVKAIVFSSFRKTLDIFGTEIIREFGSDSVAEFWGAYRSSELKKFRTNYGHVWTCGRCGHENNESDPRCSRQLLQVSFTDMAALVGAAAADDELQWVYADHVGGWSLGRRYYIGDRVSVGGRGGIVTKFQTCPGKAQRDGAWQRRHFDCFVLLLGQDGSHGLDLSFVTHIFLMESIWDTSLEAQVIARAHRMGSRTSVLVEQLVARDTVDEVLCRIKAGTLTVAGEDGDGGAAEHDGRRRGSGRRARPPSAKALRKRLEGGRLRFVLRQLRLLRTAEDAVPRVADDGRGAAPLPERPPLRRRRIAAAEGGADEPRGGEKRVRFAL